MNFFFHIVCRVMVGKFGSARIFGLADCKSGLLCTCVQLRSCCNSMVCHASFQCRYPKPQPATAEPHRGCFSTLLNHLVRVACRSVYSRSPVLKLLQRNCTRPNSCSRVAVAFQPPAGPAGEMVLMHRRHQRGDVETAATRL
jgi:hypothetical protein